jgi:hypothetical protein
VLNLALIHTERITVKVDLPTRNFERMLLKFSILPLLLRPSSTVYLEDVVAGEGERTSGLHVSLLAAVGHHTQALH